jgi:hypothetical protein
MIDDEKNIDVRNLLLRLPQVKASDDFMIKLQHKINLSENSAPLQTQKKRFFRKYILVPSLSFGTILITGIIVWAVFFHNPVNQFSDVNTKSESPQPNQNLAVETPKSDIQPNGTKIPQQNQTEQSLSTTNDNNHNEQQRQQEPTQPVYRNEPSERVTPYVQPMEEKSPDINIQRESRKTEANPPLPNRNYQNQTEPTDKILKSDAPVRIKVDESPSDSRKIKSKDFNGGVSPDNRDNNVSSPNQPDNPISSPDKSTKVNKDDSAPVMKDKTDTVKKDSSSKNKKESVTKDKKNPATKNKPKDNAKGNIKASPSPKPEPEKKPQEQKQNN